MSPPVRPRLWLVWASQKSDSTNSISSSSSNSGKIGKLSAASSILSGMIKIDPSQFTCSFLGTFPTNAAPGSATATMQMRCHSSWPSFLLIIQENTQTRGAPNNNNHFHNDTDFGLGNQANIHHRTEQTRPDPPTCLLKYWTTAERCTPYSWHTFPHWRRQCQRAKHCRAPLSL